MSRPRAAAGAKAKAKPEPVVFRGPPDRLASVVPLAALPEDPAGAESVVTLKGAEVRGLRVRSRAPAAGEARAATLRLPETTPPGTYRGSAELAGRAIPILAEVAPRPRLQSHPRRLELSAEPGATVTEEVTLVNAGNVPCEIARATTFCLFDGGGIEHALWAALGQDPPKGRSRMDVLLDDLAASHGGLVEARAEKAGSVQPGASRTIRLTLSFSDRLRPGHGYGGAWETEGLRLPVRVRVPAKRETRAKAAR